MAKHCGIDIDIESYISIGKKEPRSQNKKHGDGQYSMSTQLLTDEALFMTMTSSWWIELFLWTTEHPGL